MYYLRHTLDSLTEFVSRLKALLGSTHPDAEMLANEKKVLSRIKNIILLGNEDQLLYVIRILYYENHVK